MSERRVCGVIGQPCATQRYQVTEPDDEVGLTAAIIDYASRHAGVDHVHRDLILGHSLQGMDVHYMAPSEEDLHRAMAKYTEWLDGQIECVRQNVNNSIKKGQPTLADPLLSH